ncbi:MAG: GntR family transcriptional regulator, partial [Hyphomicrobiaceae bacterium]
MASSERLDARPLYLQVQELLTRRISSGTLGPGAALPNEFQIAGELGVSQGTVRKALDALAAARLVVRVQGKGTFVVEQTPEEVHFRFFNIFDATGQRVLPESRETKV